MGKLAVMNKVHRLLGDSFEEVKGSLRHYRRELISDNVKAWLLALNTCIIIDEDEDTPSADDTNVAVFLTTY